MINSIKCLFKGHNNVQGSCPFTGKTYDICQNCGKSVAIRGNNETN